MFNRDALNNEWIKAAEAYREYRKNQDFYDNVSLAGECDHVGAKRNKDGSRDKRSDCRECFRDMLKAQDDANCLDFEWSSIWDLFERIGMSVKRKETAGVGS